MKPVTHLLAQRLMLAHDPGDRLDALLDIAENHADAFRSREGLRAAREALVIARGCSHDVAVGRALAAATVCHYQRGDHVAAVATGLDAIAAFADGDRGGRSSALRSIALALHAVEAADLAETAARQAVADAVAISDADREAHARETLGRVLLQGGNHHGARREFRLAAARHRSLGNLAHVKKAVTGLGHTYRLQAESMAPGPEADFERRQALRVYEIARTRRGAEADDGMIERAMAECCCRLGHLPLAMAHLGRALDIARRVGNSTMLAECFLWESRVLKAMGDLAAAQAACERACDAAAPLDRLRAEAFLALAGVHDAQGRFERASDAEAHSRNLRLEREASLALVRTELGPLWERGMARKQVSDTCFTA